MAYTSAILEQHFPYHGGQQILLQVHDTDVVMV